MKNTLIILLTILVFTACEKKDNEQQEPLTPLQQLPPKTQVGANTAGCLVDGEAFLPKGFTPSGNLICNYINQKDFSLNIYDNSGNKSHSINIASRNLKLEINSIYILKKKNNNSQLIIL